MAYRKITVIEIKEVLRLWLQNRHGLRPIAETVGADRTTVRRYIEAVRPERPAGHGAAWEACRAEHDRIKAWLEKDLKLTKVADLLARRGVVVLYRTLHRYTEAALELAYRELVGLTDPELADVRAQPSWPVRVAAAHTIPREVRAFASTAFDRQLAAAITVPTLLLVGTESPAWGPEAQFIVAALPDARIAYLAGQDHIADLLAPEAVATARLPCLLER